MARGRVTLRQASVSHSLEDFKSKDIQKRSVSVSGGGEAFHLLPLGVLRASQLAMTIDDHATLDTV